MKRVIQSFISVLAIITILAGCTSQTTEKSVANSGTLDETYVGDADVKIVENYKQTAEEAKIQEEVLKQIEQTETETESEGLGGHF